MAAVTWFVAMVAIFWIPGRGDELTLLKLSLTLKPTRREINSAAHFGQISVQHFDPIKWWNHEIQIKEACDIHAWHIQYYLCSTYTAFTCELYEFKI